MSSTNLSKMLFDNTNFRTSYVATARSMPVPSTAASPAPVLSSRRSVNPAFHLSRFISNAANTGPCKACGS
jgi:hypothetical protein